MESAFTAFAVVGGTILVLQLLLTFIGLDGDLDSESDIVEPDVDTGSTWYFGVFSVKALVAGTAFFGLAGRIALTSGYSPVLAVLAGLLAAGTAMVSVAWMTHLIYQMRSDGTVTVHDAVGLVGSVYLPVPQSRDGHGKVTVAVRARTCEYEALTDDDALPAGTPVELIEALNEYTVLVRRTAPRED